MKTILITKHNSALTEMLIKSIADDGRRMLELGFLKTKPKKHPNGKRRKHWE